MEERKLKIIFNKSGSGSITPKMNIPMSWVKDMGVTPEDREVNVVYDKETKSFTAKKLSK